MALKDATLLTVLPPPRALFYFFGHAYQHFGQFLEKTDAGDISKNRGTITPISTDTSHGLHIKNCLKRYTQR